MTRNGSYGRKPLVFDLESCSSSASRRSDWPWSFCDRARARGLPANPDEHGSRTVECAAEGTQKVRLFVILRFSTSRFSEPLRQRLRGDGPSRDTISPRHFTTSTKWRRRRCFSARSRTTCRRLVSRARRRRRRQRFRRVGGSDHGTGRGQGTCAGADTRRKAACNCRVRSDREA